MHSSGERKETISMLRRTIALFFFGLALCFVAASGPAAQADAAPAAAPMLGFTSEHAAAHRALQAKLAASPTRKQIEEWIRQLSSRPHHVGSPGNKANTDMIAALFREWGCETTVERFDVLFPTPKERVLELVAPTKFKASLDEGPVAEDPTYGPHAEGLPPSNAYSIDGDVTGELVYVNFGVPADYDELRKRGVDVKGRIVIARYGASWRGIKPKVAAEHGAIGCIIYSDPAEDGSAVGEPYPKGGYRPPQGVQRGSVADIPVYAGDPLTPGVAAVPGARRLRMDEVQVFTRIPVLPISAQDAEHAGGAGGPRDPLARRGACSVGGVPRSPPPPRAAARAGVARPAAAGARGGGTPPGAGRTAAASR